MDDEEQIEDMEEPEQDEGISRPSFQEEPPPRRSFGSRVSGFVSAIPRIPLPTPPEPEPEPETEELTPDDMLTVSEEDEEFFYGVPDEMTEDDPSLYTVDKKSMDWMIGGADEVISGKKRVKYGVGQSKRRGKNRPGSDSGLYGIV